MFENFINEINIFIASTTFIVGLIFYIISKIIGKFTLFPRLAVYKIISEFLGLCLIIAGSYFLGVVNSNKTWFHKLEIAKLQIEKAEAEAKAANARVEYVFVDKVQKIKDVQIVVQEKIRDITVKVDEKCQVDKSAIDVLNSAAANRIQKEK